MSDVATIFTCYAFVQPCQPERASAPPLLLRYPEKLHLVKTAPDTNLLIEGGNHAQFGNYGQQKGDPPAAISSEEQQDIAVQAILDFIKQRSDKSDIVEGNID